MTPEQKIAYINAQTVCAMIEAMGMAAENNVRFQGGFSAAYRDDAFFNIAVKYGIEAAQLKKFLEPEVCVAGEVEGVGIW